MSNLLSHNYQNTINSLQQVFQAEKAYGEPSDDPNSTKEKKRKKEQFEKIAEEQHKENQKAWAQFYYNWKRLKNMSTTMHWFMLYYDFIVGLFLVLVRGFRLKIIEALRSKGKGAEYTISVHAKYLSRIFKTPFASCARFQCS